MTLRLVREPTLNGATLGCLFVDGHWQAFTLEDAIRPTKIPGETAIPAGRYSVALTYSQRFARTLPILRDVPGFDGIRIHAGNGPLDTLGCILVGRDRAPGRVLQSRVALAALLAKLTDADPIVMDIENPMEA